MSSQAMLGTPVRGSKRPRSNSNASDSSSGSDPSSPVPIFSSTQRAASNYSASSPPDLEQHNSPSNALAPTPTLISSYTGLEKTPKEVPRAMPTQKAGLFVPYQVKAGYHATSTQAQIATRLSDLRKRFPDALIEEVVDGKDYLHLRCHDCPDHVYKVYSNLSSITNHLSNRKHIENVHNRTRAQPVQTPSVKSRSLRSYRQPRTVLADLASTLAMSSGLPMPPSSSSEAYLSSHRPTEKHTMLVDSAGNSPRKGKGKEPERTGQPLFSNANPRASPITAPEVDSLSKVSLTKDFNGNGRMIIDGARRSEIPDLILQRLLDFHTSYPDDSIYVTAGSNIRGELLVSWKCDDCMGPPYPLHLGKRNLTDLSEHLRYSGHVANVHGRPSLQGQMATVTPAVTSRMEQLRRDNATSDLYYELVDRGAPLGSGHPRPIPNSNSLSGTSRPNVPSSIPLGLGNPSPSHDPIPTTTRSLPAGSSSKQDYASQTAEQIQANISTTGPAPKEVFTEEYKLALDNCIQEVGQHSSTLKDQTKTMTDQSAQVQRTMQMLGDILDASATQNTVLERMRVDTTEWIKDLEKENKKQKATIDRLRLELRTQRDDQKAFEANTAARFASMAQDNKAQLALVMDSIRGGDKANTPKELGVPQIGPRVSPRKRARHM